MPSRTFIKSLLVLIQQLALKSWATPVETTACLGSASPFTTCPRPFKFAVLGDSWASGVSYNSETEYDDNADNCLRNKEAYGVQMQDDVSWAGPNVQFDFPACSGSRLINMAKENCQICQVKDPDLVIITVGGNNMDFYPVVDSCVYHSQSKDYGPELDSDPERKGMCAKSIDKAASYIDSKDEGGLRRDLERTYQDLLESKQAKKNHKLRIYHTGYAHFFSEEKGSKWCDKSALRLGGPKMTHGVRRAINELVSNANSAIQEVTSSFSEHHMGYVSITEGFDGHRFCEPGGTTWGQYFSKDVWFWTIVPALAVKPTWEKEPEEYDNYPWVGPQLFDFSKPGNSSEGFLLRPFHPKVYGFKAIKDSIIEKLKADKVPGVIHD